MIHRPLPRHVLAGFALAAFVLAASPASAQSKAECLASFDRAQELQGAMKLRAAREEFRSCARAACSPPVRKDCSQILEDISRDMPTFVFGARTTEGVDIGNVTVFLDGEKVTTPSGFPVDVDPGPHALRFEVPSAAPVEQTLTARAGERNRLVIATFPSSAASPVAPPASSAGASAGGAASPSASREESSVSPWVYVTTGLGVVALGSFVGFGLSGASERSRLEDTCAPGCPEDDMASVRTRFIVADVSLGVAVVSLAAAAILYFTRSSGASARTKTTASYFFARSF